ncbi:hypothetical protein PR202_ga22512 [Eleusine coracana subsp. coracana]|uniref:BPM/SPOP BACK domain-containing protein n=1 Tax=Eleusine coracana subsp. coracana TaxID=191504 RepID=A0AAV5D498_ELECO|nr:hypothetical protein PR202_ga22512 [Eleusine coracana subsp. coracana]
MSCCCWLNPKLEHGLVVMASGSSAAAAAAGEDSGSTSSIVADTTIGWHVLKIECYVATKDLGISSTSACSTPGLERQSQVATIISPRPTRCLTWEDGEKTVMAQHLLVAADRYDLKRLKLISEDRIRGHIDRSTVATTLVLAEQHGCEGLKEACLVFLLSPGVLREVMGTDEYQHLRLQMKRSYGRRREESTSAVS